MSIRIEVKSDRPRVVILYEVDSHSILLPLVVLISPKRIRQG